MVVIAIPLRPCLDCGQLSVGPRCPKDMKAKQRAKRQRRPYTSTEQARRAEVVRAWVGQYGYVCPGWRRPPHPSMDLTADHVASYAVTGDEAGPLLVLCRSCNGAKGATV